jgi:hypothetical protein
MGGVMMLSTACRLRQSMIGGMMEEELQIGVVRVRRGLTVDMVAKTAQGEREGEEHGAVGQERNNNALWKEEDQGEPYD